MFDVRSDGFSKCSHIATVIVPNSSDANRLFPFKHSSSKCCRQPIEIYSRIEPTSMQRNLQRCTSLLIEAFEAFWSAINLFSLGTIEKGNTLPSTIVYSIFFSITALTGNIFSLSLPLFQQTFPSSWCWRQSGESYASTSSCSPSARPRGPRSRRRYSTSSDLCCSTRKYRTFAFHDFSPFTWNVSASKSVTAFLGLSSRTILSTGSIFRYFAAAATVVMLPVNEEWMSIFLPFSLIFNESKMDYFAARRV